MCPANCKVENRAALDSSEYMLVKPSEGSAQLTRGIVPPAAYPKIPPPPERGKQFTDGAILFHNFMNLFFDNFVLQMDSLNVGFGTSGVSSIDSMIFVWLEKKLSQPSQRECTSLSSHTPPPCLRACCTCAQSIAPHARRELAL